MINIKDSELAVIVLQENGTRLGLGKLGHRVPDFSDPGLVTRYQAEVLQPVEGRSSDSFPAFQGVPTFHVEVGPLFALRRSGESHYSLLLYRLRLPGLSVSRWIPSLWTMWFWRKAQA